MWCLNNFPGAFWMPKGNWWDGYVGQKSVVVDDFYGWISIDSLLRICDRYPLHLEIKGSHVQFQADTIVFTSNKPWTEWYKTMLPEHVPAFARRVDEEYHFTKELQPDGRDIVVVEKKQDDGTWDCVLRDGQIQW